MFQLPKATLLLVVLLTLNATTHADTVAEQKAIRLISTSGNQVTGIAYPTVTHTKTTFVDGVRFTDGTFTLTYTFHGSWDGTNGSFTQRFCFTQSGMLYNIENVSRSWFFEPFTEWELARELIREIAKDELKKDKGADLITRLSTGESVLKAILNLKLGFDIE